MKATPDISFYSRQDIEGLRNRKDPEAIKVLAREIESLFAYEMIKAMRETTMPQEKGLGSDVYMSMFDMEIARIFAERGIGLQDLLLKKVNTVNKENSGQNIELRTEHTEGKVLQNSEIKQKNHIHNAGKPKNCDPVTLCLKTTTLDMKFDVLNPDFTVNMPVEGKISSKYGMRRHPLYGDYRFHNGIDIAAPEGTEVFPFKGGRVIFSGEQQGYGNVVIIDHGDGYTSKYGHNKLNIVKAGDIVDANTVIAYVGSTGLSTGPHLHFEVKYNGERINPTAVVAIRKN